MIDFVALPLAGVLVIGFVGSIAASRLRPRAGARAHTLAVVIAGRASALWVSLLEPDERGVGVGRPARERVDTN